MDLIVGAALVMLVWFNQINKTNQTDRTDQMNKFQCGRGGK